LIGRVYSRDMLADTQTQRQAKIQTNTLITILHFHARDEVITEP